MTNDQSLTISWAPPGCTAGDIAGMGEWLRSAGQRLRASRSVEQIAEVLDAAAVEWIGRANTSDEIVKKVAAHSDLSPEMVARCIRAEQTSSRKDDLIQALNAELGSAACLDQFVWQPGLNRHIRATGPGLVLAILPGNIPGLSHLPLMRSLLVKSPVLAKAASGEPYYAAAYAESIARIDPLVGDCLGIVRWPGGNQAIESTVAEMADAVIVYGARETIKSWRMVVPRPKPLVEHGHKLGFLIADPTWLAADPDRLDAIALDICMYDQAACLAPHVVIVLGDHDDSERVGRDLANAMERLHKQLPCGGDVTDARTTRRAWIDQFEWESTGDSRMLANGPWGAVALETSGQIKPTCGLRTIAVAPAGSIAAALSLLAGWQDWLQNAGLAVPAEVARQLAVALADMGCTRLAPAGAMPFPSMRWHHDGRPALSDLVRFTNVEGPAEEPLDTPWL